VANYRSAIDRYILPNLGRAIVHEVEFLDFLRLVAKAYPRRQLHVVVDNYATHKHAKVQAWLARHLPRPNRTSAAPGSAEGLYLIVSDIQAARDALVAAGIQVSEVFHPGTDDRVSGPDPEHRSYLSFASFSDPGGNRWLFQEVTTRLPGRVDPAATSFGSASDLASAMRRASAAHGEHEKRIGAADPNWPDWYADYMVREQAGEELPS
jgi:hypothetical protein